MARIPKSHNPDLFPFRIIRVSIPQKRYRKFLKMDNLPLTEMPNLCTKRNEIEIALNKLNNALTSVNRIISKHSEIKIKNSYF